MGVDQERSREAHTNGVVRAARVEGTHHSECWSKVGVRQRCVRSVGWRLMPNVRQWLAFKAAWLVAARRSVWGAVNVQQRRAAPQSYSNEQPVEKR